MTAKKDLLIEIGTEELPPKALKRLAVAFADGIRQGLADHNLAHGDCRWYATPRRLAVTVARVAIGQDDHEVVKRGPAQVLRAPMARRILALVSSKYSA